MIRKIEIKRVVLILIIAIITVCIAGISNGYSTNITGTVTSSIGVNMRTEPDTSKGNKNIIMAIPYNEKVEIIGTAQGSGYDWYHIRYNNKMGYAVCDGISKDSSGNHETGDFTNTYATVNSDIGVNVRSGPGTNYDIIDGLVDGAEVKVNGKAKDSNGNVWYEITCSTGKGYVFGEYLILKEEKPYEPDANFEQYLTNQGFPESYKVFLRQLHAQYPNWIFVAGKTNLDWNYVISKEYGGNGRRPNTIQNGQPDSWKSMEDGDYNFATGQYKSYDSGYYVAASRSLIEHYMDPRNFLNSTDIFQFISSKYVPSLQNSTGLQRMLNGTFMSGSFPESTYPTYNAVLMDAANRSKVSPYTLATMIMQEQGHDGSGHSISGRELGYYGIYNYFNIGAYAANGLSAVENGLIYARNQGWNTRAKSILGGANWFGKRYVYNNMYTQYLKKFNVMNGAGSVATGQYMTHVMGAYLEGANLRKAYKDFLNTSLTFEIPVYNNMPETVSPMPGRYGNNNNFLDGISVGSKSVPSFNRFTYTYNVDVGNATIVNLSAKANNSAAKVEGIGQKTLKAGINTFNITVTATSGEKRVYTVNVKTTGAGDSSGLPEYRLLKKGMQGEDVKYFQRILKENGYLDGSYSEGIFDERTENAVILLQLNNGLKSPDGMIGNWTRNKIQKGVKKFSFDFNHKTDINYLLQKEMKNKGYLLVEPDGWLGNNTRNGIKAFTFTKSGLVDDTINLTVLLDIMDENCVRINALSGYYVLGNNNTAISHIKARMSLFGFDTLNNGNVFDLKFQRELNVYQTLGGINSDGIFGAWSAANLNSGNIYNHSIVHGESKNTILGFQILLKSVCELKVTPDGIFGNNTYSALKSFQSKFGLPVTGAGDYQTLKKLNEIKHESTSSDYYLDFKRVVGKGDSGADVLVLQRKLSRLGYLKVNPDGIFGNNTYQSLIIFQKDYNLTSDGICGMATVSALNKN